MKEFFKNFSKKAAALLKNKKFLMIAVPVLVVAIVGGTLLGVLLPRRDKGLDPEKRPFVIQVNELDGVFSPFFYSSAYDGDVIGLTQVSLLTVDRGNAIVAGDEYATVAKSFTINYDEDTQKTTYEFVLKNGLKFSNGSPITAEDVIFNMYVYADMLYDGSSTFYNLAIEGMRDYRTQIVSDIYDKYDGYAKEIFAKGSDYTVTEEDAFTQEMYDDFWEGLAETQGAFVQDIVDYVVGGYNVDANVKGWLDPAYDAAQVAENVGLQVAFSMTGWGFGGMAYVASDDGTFVKLAAEYEEFDADNEDHAELPQFNLVTEYVEDEEGAFVKVEDDFVAFDETNEAHEGLTRYTEKEVYKAVEEGEEGDFVRTLAAGYYEYDETEHEGLDRYNKVFQTAVTETNFALEGDDYPTNADFWNELFVDYDGNYDNITADEGAGGYPNPLTKALSDFVVAYGRSESTEAIDTISGISKGTKLVDNVSHETVTVVLNGRNPKALLQMGVTVAPKYYYTEGFNYTDDMKLNAGVPRENAAFIAHLKTKNARPVGAGPYVFNKYEDNVVYFERNTNFESFGLGNAKIKNVAMKVISLGSEYDSLVAKDIDYATVSATSSVMESIASNSYLTGLLVDNLGYGYISINPTVEEYRDINVRKAIQSAFDIDVIHDYYSNGLAEVIHRSMSKVSWAYPEGAESLYPYDDTGAKSKEYLEAAGYVLEDGKMMKDGKQATFTFTLPSAASEHPAGQIYLNAKTKLEEIGCEVEIVVDTNLIANIKSGEVGCYALAWQAASDPDLYQVYHYESQANSVISNGIKWLHANGTSEEIAMLEELASYIEEALTYLEVDERAPIYANALEVLAELVLEIPTYQRKNLFVYNSEAIDGTTLAQDITPYWGPLAEIWNVEYK